MLGAQLRGYFGVGQQPQYLVSGWGGGGNCWTLRSLTCCLPARLTVEECTTFRQRRADELAAQAAALKEAEAAK